MIPSFDGESSTFPGAPGFDRRDRFFLSVEATDPRFDREGTRRFLESLGPKEVFDVAP